MLPLWLSVMNNELNVCIRPNSLIVRRFKGLRGTKLTCVDRHKIVLNKTLSHADIDAAYLARSLQAILKLERWKASRLTVVLSNQFVRYAVIPWNANINSAEESKSYLNHHFLTMYGEAVASWNKCLSPTKYGHTALASAVPNGLIQIIDDVVSTMPITLSSVQPYLMEVANQARAVIKSQNLSSACWLAVIADDRVCLCLIVEGQWFWVKSVQQETDAMAQIDMLIERECLVNSVIDRLLKQSRQLPMLLHSPDKLAANKIHLKHYRVIRLTSSKLFAHDPDEGQVARLVTS